MAYKTFVNGAVLPASDMNTYLMNQTVMVFADATARDAALTSPTEGMFAYLTGNDHYTIYNGSSWQKFDIATTAYTPTLSGFSLGTGGTSQGYYSRMGNWCTFNVYLGFGTGLSFTGAINISLPITQASTPRFHATGRGNPSSTSYLLQAVAATGTNTFNVYAVGSSGAYATFNLTGAAIPNTWVAGNTLTITGTYEVA
jgi:hypothetical protein